MELQFGPSRPFLGASFRHELQHASHVIPREASQQSLEESAPDGPQQSAQGFWLKQPAGAAAFAHLGARYRRHVAALKTPAAQLEEPLGLKPSSHVGWHVWPLWSTASHDPMPPFRTGTVASHALGSHTPAASLPFRHSVGPDSE